MNMMKGMAAGVALTFSAGAAQALECEVRYKAKKTVSETFLFQEKKTQKYKAGKVRGKGASIGACENNALKPLKARGWTVTSARAKQL